MTIRWSSPKSANRRRNYRWPERAPASAAPFFRAPCSGRNAAVKKRPRVGGTRGHVAWRWGGSSAGSPHLLGGLDHQPQLGGLLLDRDVVAVHGRGEAAL